MAGSNDKWSSRKSDPEEAVRKMDERVRYDRLEAGSASRNDNLPSSKDSVQQKIDRTAHFQRSDARLAEYDDVIKGRRR